MSKLTQSLPARSNSSILSTCSEEVVAPVSTLTFNDLMLSWGRSHSSSVPTMGLNMCGVDILRSNRGPVVMEVNSSPGLEGIETATGKDVASMIVEFIVKNAKPNNTKTRGKG